MTDEPVRPGPAAVLVAVGEALRAAKDQLNEADIVRPATATSASLPTPSGGRWSSSRRSWRRSGPAAAMRRLGMEIGSRAPSTFGTLLSMGLIGAARAEAGLDAPDASPTPTEAATG